MLNVKFVAPHVGAWIETFCCTGNSPLCASHPMWVRGLKPQMEVGNIRFYQSHPMWVRGLKHFAQKLGTHQIKVAPHVGAWIETSIRLL